MESFFQTEVSRDQLDHLGGTFIADVIVKINKDDIPTRLSCIKMHIIDECKDPQDKYNDLEKTVAFMRFSTYSKGKYFTTCLISSGGNIILQLIFNSHTSCNNSCL